MKNILIPTDFNSESLACIEDFCRQHEDKRFQLIFIHFFKLSDSISELLMLSRRNKEYEYVSDEFYQKCESIKERYAQVEGIKVDFFYGSTLSMFRNYLEAHLVDAVLVLKNYPFKPLNKQSLNPEKLIQKCGLQTIQIQPENPKGQKDYDPEALLRESI